MIIDQDFKKLIDPLIDKEFNGLEQKILREGFKEPVIIWKEENILLDGHNRVKICKAYKIPYTERYISLPSRNAAINWIIDNQLSRRNLSPNQAAYLRGKKYLAEKQTHGGQLPKKGVVTVTTPFGKTRDKVARETGVSHKTITNDANYAQAVDKISDKLDASKVKAEPRKDVIALSKKPVEEQKQIIEIVKEKNIPIKKAIPIAKKEKQKIIETQSQIIESVESIPDNPLVKNGEWWQLGRHRLYCGDTSSEAFIKNLEPCAFAFADPPYNANAAEWDNDFNWQHDYLTDFAKIVAVTPGIISIQDFMRLTSMPYSWSLAGIITNGMTRGAIGFGNWIFTALFSHNSVYQNAQDIITLSIKTSETSETQHKGRKPAEFLSKLFDKFTEKNDTIIDPFLGSGQTLLACEQSNRSCIGGEINPAFCNEIVSRWKNLTGEKAEHDNTI
ncbi:hypothetical protein J7L67_04015 [bacterium]|nr:hypothetical protein [bacterium]